MKPKKIVPLLLSCTLLLSACGDDGEPEPRAAATSPSSDEPSTEPTETPQTNGTTALEVWLTEGDALRPTIRQVPETTGVARAALEAMLEGPTAREEEVGLGSEIPEGVELLDVSLSDGLLTADLSSEYDDGGGSATMRMRLAQLVYTATQFDSVTSVKLRMDGEDVETFSSEGIVVSDPQTRKAYRDLLPAIVVLGPAIDEEVSSPLRIEGTANVFEATVSFRLVVDGAPIAEGFATATCGTGCRGTYSETLAFEVEGPTEATLEVFESSAEDGSPMNLVSIPITLEP